MAAIHQGIHRRFTESRIFQEGLEIPVQRVVLFYHDHDFQILFHVLYVLLLQRLQVYLNFYSVLF